MALNWTMLDASHSPLPLPNELNITTIHEGVDISLTIPNSPPSGSSTAGGSGGSKKLSEVGKLWLTDQRLIFTTLKPSSSAPLSSLSIPLPAVLSTNFHQPTFGANYLSLTFKPSQGGGLEGGGVAPAPPDINGAGSTTTPTNDEGNISAEIRFKDRPMFEFVSLLEKTRERAIYMKRQKKEEEEAEGLPVYTTPFEPSSESTSVLVAPDTPLPPQEESTDTSVDGPPGYAA